MVGIGVGLSTLKEGFFFLVDNGLRGGGALVQRSHTIQFRIRPSTVRFSTYSDTTNTHT